MRVATETGLTTRRANPSEAGAPTLPSAEQLLASAVSFLVEGGEEEAAGVLLACSLGLHAAGGAWYDGDELHAGLHVELSGPRAAYELLADDHHPIRGSSHIRDETANRHKPPGYMLQIDSHRQS